MKMQFVRSISALAVGAALVAMTGQASASDGAITFTGSVDASTCTISTSGTAGSFTVPLPKVSVAALDTVAETAGDTAFSIRLTGCSDTVGSISTNFEAGSAVDAATGRLNNTAATTPATNVQLQLVNASNNSPIVVGAPVASQNSLGVALASDGAPTPAGVGTLNYIARYYATGAATAGAVGSQVTYSLVLP
jgi:major type 1 subunit fimbrin (pilin)